MLSEMACLCSFLTQLVLMDDFTEGRYVELNDATKFLIFSVGLFQAIIKVSEPFFWKVLVITMNKAFNANNEFVCDV